VRQIAPARQISRESGNTRLCYWWLYRIQPPVFQWGDWRPSSQRSGPNYRVYGGHVSSTHPVWDFDTDTLVRSETRVVP